MGCVYPCLVKYRGTFLTPRKPLRELIHQHVRKPEDQEPIWGSVTIISGALG